MTTQVHVHSLGEAYKRKEDARFIRGQGNYVDDVQLPGMLYGMTCNCRECSMEISCVAPMGTRSSRI